MSGRSPRPEESDAFESDVNEWRDDGGSTEKDDGTGLFRVPEDDEDDKHEEDGEQGEDEEEETDIDCTFVPVSESAECVCGSTE